MKIPHIPGSFKHHSHIKPMLAELHDSPFDDAGWIFEIKYDGYRAIAEIDGKNIRFYSRKGTDYSTAYPRIYNELKELQKLDVQMVLDGEIVFFDENGKPSFQGLQNYSSRSKGSLLFYVFDCLQFNGEDLRVRPLVERKKKVEELLGTIGTIRYCDHYNEFGTTLFAHTTQMGLEGIIGKRADSSYVHKRSKNWLKIKSKIEQDFVIVGFVTGKASRKYFGGLILAEQVHGKLVYRGRVGSGFTERQLKDTFELIEPYKTEKSLVAQTPKIIPAPTWVKPMYTCRVQFSELTDEDIIRSPVFMGDIKKLKTR